MSNAHDDISPPSAPAMGEVLGEREDAHITQ